MHCSRTVARILMLFLVAALVTACGGEGGRELTAQEGPAADVAADADADPDDADADPDDADADPDDATGDEGDADTIADDEVPEVGDGQGIDLLAGEVINLVVPYGPGGSYDRNARALQPYLQGASLATVVAMNEPGAGSLLATNRTFTSDPDEHRLQMFNTLGVAGAQLGDAEGVQYDLREFAWIGGVAAEPEVAVVRTGSPLAAEGGIEEAIASGEQLVFGSTGPGDNFWINALLIEALLGIDIDIVSGFESAPEVYNAVVRGDVDVAFGSLTSAVSGAEAGDVEPLTWFGDAPDAPEVDDLLDGVPELADLAADAGQDVATIEAFIGPYLQVLEVNRVLGAAPGTPDDLVAAYREAVAVAMADDAFATAASDQMLYMDHVPGEDVEQAIEQILDSTPEFIDLVRRSYEG